MKARTRVLIGPSTFGAFDPAPLEKLKAAGCEIVPNPVGRKMTKDEVSAALKGIDGIIAGLEPLSREILEHSQLKVISRCGVGMANVDLTAARERGIKVYCTPEAPTTAVAELTAGAMICLMRRLSLMDRQMHSGVWNKLSGPQVAGKTVCIVGLGRIGLKVAALLQPFGVKLMGVDPVHKGPVNGIPIVTLDQALPQSDVISIHASGSAEIIGEREFGLMRCGAYLMNVGRGGLVNEPALCEALDKKIVAGAWLDTFGEEPYQGPLQKYDRVLLTPHIGYSSDECRKQMEMEAVDNLLAGLVTSEGGCRTH